MNIDPENMREMWANYYEKRRIKKEAKALQKDRNNQMTHQLVMDHTTELIAEIEKLKNRLKNRNEIDSEIEKTINNLHYENQTIYNEYKNKPEKYKKYYDKYLNLKNKIINL